MAEIPKFIPLADIDRVDPPPRVSFEVVVPEYVDKEQIGINLTAIEKLCRMSGIRSLRVFGVSGDISSFTPDIIGMDGRGHALAAWKGTRKEVPMFETQFEKSSKALSHARRWIDATIKVNTNEINAKIGDSKVKGGVRSIPAWSKKLNSSIKEGIRQVGFQHLILNTTLGDKIVGASCDAQLLYGLNSTAFRWFLGLHTGTNMIDLITDRMVHGESEDGLHLSLFAGPQLDRAIILGIAGRTTRLVKSLENPEQT